MLALVFWLLPRYHDGGPRWSKTAILCKLPVLQQGHLGKKGFFSLLFRVLLLEHTLQRLWAIGLMESWFCIWMIWQIRK
jgi:hypothetical protein